MSNKKEVFFVFNCNNNSYIGTNNKPTDDLHDVKYMTEEEADKLSYDLGPETWGIGSCTTSET